MAGKLGRDLGKGNLECFQRVPCEVNTFGVRAEKGWSPIRFQMSPSAHLAKF